MALAREEAAATNGSNGHAPVDPHALVCADGLPPPALDPLDMAILLAWMERKSWAAMAKSFGTAYATIRARWDRPAMQAVVSRLQRNLFDQLSRGDFGGLALVKANQVSAIKVTLKLMRTASRESVQLDAARDILKLAGMQPAQAKIVDRPETLLDEMTQEELEHFSLTNEFPRRLADRLARVAAGVLQARVTKEEGTVDGETRVDWERVGPAPYVPEVVAAPPLDPEPDAPLELPDEDGPEWGGLPDETALDEEEVAGGGQP